MLIGKNNFGLKKIRIVSQIKSTLHKIEIFRITIAAFDHHNVTLDAKYKNRYDEM